MSDQCNSCTHKGNIKNCLKTDCSFHDIWIVENLITLIGQVVENAIVSEYGVLIKSRAAWTALKNAYEYHKKIGGDAIEKQD